MVAYPVSFLTQRLNKQKNYKLSSACKVNVFAVTPVKRWIIETNGGLLATIPNCTAHHEVQMVAKVLQGEARQIRYLAAYHIASQPIDDSSEMQDYTIMGELDVITGLVKDDQILMLYPEFDGDYKIAYDSVKQMAEAINGRMENIVVRVYYKIYVGE